MRPVKEADIRKLYPQLTARRKKGAKAEDLAHWLYTYHGLTEPDGSPLSPKRVQSMMQRVGGAQARGSGSGQRTGGRRTAAPSKAAGGPARSGGPGWGVYAAGIVTLLLALGALVMLQQMS
jgi:hypothetical protein